MGISIHAEVTRNELYRRGYETCRYADDAVHRVYLHGCQVGVMVGSGWVEFCFDSSQSIDSQIAMLEPIALRKEVI